MKTDIIVLHFEDRCPYEVGNFLKGPISDHHRSHIDFPGLAEIVEVTETTTKGDRRRQFEARLKVTLPDSFTSVKNEGPDASRPKLFSGAYWLRSKIPVAELDGRLCLIRIRQSHEIREGVFTLEARAHHALPEFHLINARQTAWDGARGITEILALDQYRADQLRRVNDCDDYAFSASFDLDVLHYVPEIQAVMEQRLLQELKRIGPAIG
jgi:hypothetical protein